MQNLKCSQNWRRRCYRCAVHNEEEGTCVQSSEELQLRMESTMSLRSLLVAVERLRWGLGR